MKGFTASPRLLLLAALALPGLALAQEAAPAVEASTRIDGVFVDLALPVALEEATITQERSTAQPFRFREVLDFSAADGSRMRLLIQLHTFPTREAGEVARNADLLRGEMIRQFAPDEVREVQVAGRAFHLLRYALVPPEGASVPDGDDWRMVDVFGAVDDVLLQVTLRLPRSFMDRESDVAAALAAMVIDVPAMLAERDAFLAESVAARGKPTVFGELILDGTLVVSQLASSRQVQRETGRELSSQQLYVEDASAPGTLGVSLSLFCDRLGPLSPEALAQRVSDELNARYAGQAPEAQAARLGPLEAVRRIGGRRAGAPGTPAVQRVSRIATGDDAVYYALIDSVDAPATVERLEAWLEEQAVPACPGPLRPRTDG